MATNTRTAAIIDNLGRYTDAALLTKAMEHIATDPEITADEYEAIREAAAKRAAELDGK